MPAYSQNTEELSFNFQAAAVIKMTKATVALADTISDHLLSGLTDATMQELIKKAGSHFRATEISTEENFNMIDGIVNNQPSQKAKKTEHIAKNTTSVLSKLKALKEIDF